jgi:histidine triad (HIT) family protein
MAEETIFERILAGDIPSESVYEDEHVYAFKDIEPQAPVHVLVIPRRKLESFADLPAADTGDVAAFMQGVAKTARALGLESSGYRVVFNTGADALQSVPYIHAHIIGGRKLSWPPG